MLWIGLVSTGPDFRMIKITNFDQRSDIQFRFGWDIGVLIKISCLGHPKTLLGENRSHLKRLKIRAFQKCHYPFIHLFQVWKK